MKKWMANSKYLLLLFSFLSTSNILMNMQLRYELTVHKNAYKIFLLSLACILRNFFTFFFWTNVQFLFWYMSKFLEFSSCERNWWLNEMKCTSKQSSYIITRVYILRQAHLKLTRICMHYANQLWMKNNRIHFGQDGCRNVKILLTMWH